MKNNERLEKFLKLQSKGLLIDDIAKELGIATSTLRSFLSKNKYKLENGKYVSTIKEKVKTTKKETKEADNTSKQSKKNTKKVVPKKDRKINITQEDLDKLCEVYDWYMQVKDHKSIKIKKQSKKNTKKVVPKKDRKINITQEDLDKLCEVYDWYMQVKDHKSIKIKPNNKKDIMLENVDLNELKSTSIKVDKKTWEDFERLCSNSQYTKVQILTQALSDFMKQYKHLL